MKPLITLLLTGLLLTCCLAPMAHAADLTAAIDAYTEAYSNGELTRIKRDIGILKLADLSYQEILVTPFMTIGDCKTEAELGVMTGMYVFDSTYALVFGKQGEFLQAQRAIETETRPRMKVSPKITREPLPPELIKELAANPDNQETLEKVFKHAQTNSDSILKQAANDPEILANLIDVMYGNVIEGLYISLSLSVNAEAAQAIHDLFLAQGKRVKKLESVLLAAQSSAERIQFLTQAKDALAQNDGNPGPDALKALLARVTQEREVHRAMPLGESLHIPPIKASTPSTWALFPSGAFVGCQHQPIPPSILIIRIESVQLTKDALT